jgi:hypothetical protein
VAESDRVDDAKDGGVRADRECQRQPCHNVEPRALPQRTQSKPHIFDSRLEDVADTYLPDLFLDLLGPTQLDQGRAPSLGLAQALLHFRARKQIEVGADFIG